MEYINEKLEEFDKYIRFRKVAIIGLGVSNIPLLDYMYNKKAQVTVFDDREEKSIPKEIMDKIKIYKFNAFFGKDNLKNLKNFDIIFRSPSCLPTEIEMLMKMRPCKIIGVTGSDRKDNNNKFD